MNGKTIITHVIMCAIFSSLFVCTINEDAGSPAITGPTEEDELPHITLLPFNPVKTGDTLQLRIFVWRDTVDTIALPNVPITINVSHGWLSSTTIATNSSGYATVSFRDTLLSGTSETRTITFTYPQYQVTATGEITVSNETIILQKHLITIDASQYIIDADGASNTSIVVKIKNENFNPIPGQTILFSTNAGDITESGITDASGTATANLTSEKRNVIATVTAMMATDTAKKVSTQIEFTGITITTVTEPQSIIPNGIDSSFITMTLKDAANHTISGEKVRFHTKPVSKAIITPFDSITNTRGQARCKVTGTGAISDSIIVQAAGDSVIALINYSSNRLMIDTTPLAGTKHSYIANGIDSTRITITYLAGDLVTRIANAAISVSVTSGTIDTLSTLVGTTNVNGQVAFYLKNPDFATTATITVTAVKASIKTNTTFDLYFKAAAVAMIELSGTPEVITTGGDEATITATAFDSKGNRVKDETITFKLSNGPGAGEYLKPPTATTNASGVAVTKVFSGNFPSEQQDIWIVASSFSGITSNVVKLTIAGPPAYVTFRKDIGDIVENNDGTYMLNCAALVTDINRNPVKDGTIATFSMQITGFIIYLRNAELVSDSLKYFQREPLARIRFFEDVNDNYINDPGETDRAGYPFYRGEDVVWSAGDRTYDPGPPFYDYNGNGRRDYDTTFASYEPPEPYTIITLDTLGNDTLVYCDYNGNGFRDIIEPLVDGTITKTMYESDPDFKPGFGYPDMDWNNNGIPDPATTVIIKKNVPTTAGRAANTIIFGQSDAWRLRVKVWVESEGTPSLSPEEFILPISEKDEPYFEPFSGKKYF